MPKHKPESVAPLIDTGGSELSSTSRGWGTPSPHSRLRGKQMCVLLYQTSSAFVSMRQCMSSISSETNVLALDLGEDQPTVIPACAACRIPDNLPFRFIQTF